MRTTVAVIGVGGLIWAATASDAVPADNCTSVQARCAIEVGGTCDLDTGRWRAGNSGGNLTANAPDATWARASHVGLDASATPDILLRTVMFGACVSRERARTGKK
jgi:hypothetical protein